mgnify:CR=1 FL=1
MTLAVTAETLRLGLRDPFRIARSHAAEGMGATTVIVELRDPAVLHERDRSPRGDGAQAGRDGPGDLVPAERGRPLAVGQDVAQGCLLDGEEWAHVTPRGRDHADHGADDQHDVVVADDEGGAGERDEEAAGDQHPDPGAGGEPMRDVVESRRLDVAIAQRTGGGN